MRQKNGAQTNKIHQNKKPFTHRSLISGKHENPYPSILTIIFEERITNLYSCVFPIYFNYTSMKIHTYCIITAAIAPVAIAKIRGAGTVVSDIDRNLGIGGVDADDFVFDDDMLMDSNRTGTEVVDDYEVKLKKPKSPKDAKSKLTKSGKSGKSGKSRRV